MKQTLAIAAGVCAVASAIASVAYVTLGQPDWAIAAWNLLLLPAAVYLGLRFGARLPLLAAGATAAGIGASLLWAYEFRDAGMEPWWLGLAAAWWIGIGLCMRYEWRWMAALTLALGVAAAVDFVVTLLGLPQPWLALGGLKLPLTTVWSIAIGIVIVREAIAGSPPLAIRAAAPSMAIVGGGVWIACGAGWLLTHGSQADFVNAEIVSLRGTQLTRLMAIGPLFWIVALFPLRPGDALGRAAWAVTVAGVVMVGVGALLETSLVDPDQNFRHPAVQGGWLLFISGLLPVMTLGLFGLAASGWSPTRMRSAYALAAILAPLPVVAFTIGDLAGSTVAWTAALAAFHAAPGFGWAVIGLVSATPALIGAPMAAPSG